MGTIQDDLRGPGIELTETHTAWVFLGPRAVWKVKKPVNFGFLDYSTLEKRQWACDAEARLNARLAADVYEGVVPVTLDPAGHHQFGGDGAVVDVAVVMRRLSDDVRADVLLAGNQLTAAHVESLAEHLASFHRIMPTDDAIARFGRPTVILANVRENFAQTRESIREVLSEHEAMEIERQQVAFVEEYATLLDERRRQGRIRDGHGDLRLEHVYFEGRGAPTIIDCIEFNERFRYADVCADVAFLSMDLERLGRGDLAERFLAMYARASGDYDLYRLVNFYEGYRAYVRGKVASIVAGDSSIGPDARARARAAARQFYLLALSEGRQGLLSPRVVAVGGVIASGKSTVADRLGFGMRAPIVDTDRARKYLLGVESTDRVVESPWQGAYSEESTERVYAEVFRRAESVLASGRSVVLDASFRSSAGRARARKLASDRGVPFLFVECRVAREELQRRLEKRALAPSVSDGRVEILEDFLARWEPVAELPEGEHLVVDTALPLDATLAQIERTVPTWPVGFSH